MKTPQMSVCVRICWIVLVNLTLSFGKIIHKIKQLDFWRACLLVFCGWLKVSWYNLI